MVARESRSKRSMRRIEKPPTFSKSMCKKALAMSNNTIIGMRTPERDIFPWTHRWIGPAPLEKVCRRRRPRASRQVPKTELLSPSSKAQVPKPKFPNPSPKTQVPKSNFPNQSYEAQVSKTTVQNHRSETQLPKPKFRNESSKPTLQNPSSETKVPQAKF